jgi:hypothetical protein
MSKVAHDPACNLDANANFERPPNLTSDFNVDFVTMDSIPFDNNTIIKIENKEDVKAESDYELPATAAPTLLNKLENNKPINSKEVPLKKVDPKLNKEAQKPKALFPPKKN